MTTIRARELASYPYGRDPTGDALVTRDAFAARIDAAFANVRRDALREAIEAVSGEHLNDGTGHPQDIAYDGAITDCEAAIRALIDAEAAPPDDALKLAEG